MLDFGLAKVLEDAAHADITVSAVTVAGMLVGTPAYMAAEQVQGAAADRRADVWAFGVVLYEMVTGQRPFRGTSIQETLAAILTAEPDWALVPAKLRPLLGACLERNPGNRLRDIADYRFLLEVPAAATLQDRPRPVRWWAIAAAVLAASLVAFFAGRVLSPQDSRGDAATPIRLSTLLPAGVSVTRGPGYTSSVAVSPEGRTVIIAASDKDGQRLYRRSLDRFELAVIDGTEGGSSPFFSWDGEWVGFFADGRLKRIPIAGGASVDIAEAPGFSSGATWGPDDRIVFAFGATSYLHVVPAAGGRVEPLTDKTTGRQPDAVPDGRAILFESGGQIHAFDRETGATTQLLAGTAPRYANGHVIFSRGATLLAAPLDLRDLSVGAALPLIDGVAMELPGSGGGGHYAVSRNGTLVYVPAAEAYELVVARGDGTARVVGPAQRSLENPRFSPDGRHIVVAARRRDGEPADLWVHDLNAGTASRLTSDGGRAAIWSDDGRTITYSHLGEQQGIYRTAIDGGGARSRILSLPTFHWLVGWTPDRTTLLYGQMMGGALSTSAIMAHRDASPRPVVGPGNTWGGRLSRDGKWLAYYILNAGRFEVYATPFPSTGSRWLIAEGTDPAWSHDGREMYYRRGPRLMAARVDKTAGVKLVGTRVVVDPFLPPLYDDYDVHSDGRTLAFVRPVNETQGREVAIVVNWVSEFSAADR